MARTINNRIGEKFKTIEGYTVEIIEYLHANNCTIQFEDGNIIKNTRVFYLQKGKVFNPNHKTLLGVGFIGFGNYQSRIKGGDFTKAYKVWTSMLTRCYSEKLHSRLPTYSDCTVHDSWHNFQNFAAWFEENYIEGFSLDKDIIFRGNKIYSPDTCCFVPREINSLFNKQNTEDGVLPKGVSVHGNRFVAKIYKIGNPRTNVSFTSPQEAYDNYKISREKFIKDIANEWKSKISEKAYKALHDYKL